MIFLCIIPCWAWGSLKGYIGLGPQRLRVPGLGPKSIRAHGPGPRPRYIPCEELQGTRWGVWRKHLRRWELGGAPIGNIRKYIFSYSLGISPRISGISSGFHRISMIF